MKSHITLKQQVLALAILPLVIAILAITAIVTSQSSDLARAGITTFERNMLEAKQKELLNYINLALSSIDHIYAHADPNDAVAQARVKRILTELSYGEDGYFFVYDFKGTNLVHPKQKFRIGENWINLKDADGDPVIANLIIQAQNGGGFHPYKWEKPSSSEVADKLSYAVALDKWQWMLGTGIYIDDVVAQTAAAKSDLRDSINHTFIIVAAIAVPAVIAVFLAGILLNLRERHLADTKLQNLTQRIIDTQEEERARIARELHDGISQNMVGVRYVLDLAKTKVRDGALDALETIERGSDGLNGAIKEVRRISHDLRPGLLDDLGLSAALEGLTHNFTERTKIPVALKSVAFKNLLPADAKTALYRVAQEALTNIERHADAKSVHLTLTSTQRGLQMIIEDDGNGFKNDDDYSVVRSAGGLGLRNMQERMEHFGGHLEVETSEHGTRLIAQLPKSIYLTQNRETEQA